MPLSLPLLLQLQRRGGGGLIVLLFVGGSDAGALLARKLNAAAAGQETNTEVEAARCEMTRFIVASRCREREAAD